MRRCLEHPRCLGHEAWDPQTEDGGPGCGVREHAPGCLCDLGGTAVLRGE